MPEWRKELSERKFAEFRERKARDAAREVEELKSNQPAGATLNRNLNCYRSRKRRRSILLVAAALKRIERAHQSTGSDPKQHRNILATAVAWCSPRVRKMNLIVLPALNIATVGS